MRATPHLEEYLKIRIRNKELGQPSTLVSLDKGSWYLSIEDHPTFLRLFYNALHVPKNVAFYFKDWGFVERVAGRPFL
jgi:hypothetical protein